MKLVVLDGYTENPGDLSWDALKEFGDLTVYDRTSFTESPLITERIGDAEIIITNKTPISRETIDKCPRIKLIAALATGYNVIDYNYAAEKGIPVVNVPTYGTASVSQFSIALLLEICHHIGHHDNDGHAGHVHGRVRPPLRRADLRQPQDALDGRRGGRAAGAGALPRPVTADQQEALDSGLRIRRRSLLAGHVRAVLLYNRCVPMAAVDLFLQGHRRQFDHDLHGPADRPRELHLGVLLRRAGFETLARGGRRGSLGGVRRRLLAAAVVPRPEKDIPQDLTVPPPMTGRRIRKVRLFS